MQTSKKVKLAELVEDFTVYPRNQVDGGHVNQIAAAVRAGCIMPLIIADKKSMRIVDGFHRRRALMRVHGDGYEAEVIFKDYENEADFFKEAMYLNSGHGRNMTSYDKAHAICTAMRLGINDVDIAKSIRCTLEVVSSYRVNRIVKVQPEKKADKPDNVDIADKEEKKACLKLPVRHLAGTTITEKQEMAIKSLGGNNQLFYVNQLITLIENDMLDMSNEPLIERLKLLAKLISKIDIVQTCQDGIKEKVSKS